LKTGNHDRATFHGPKEANVELEAGIQHNGDAIALSNIQAFQEIGKLRTHPRYLVKAVFFRVTVFKFDPDRGTLFPMPVDALMRGIEMVRPAIE
jgi:hypothetical protein